jgi:GMP synthase-like glutamine amidotransferase
MDSINGKTKKESLVPKIRKILVVDNQYGVCQLFKEYSDKYYVMIDDKKLEPDLLVFTGGADINPKIYGEEPIRGTHFNRARDAIDLEYWNLYPATPKVGICRGGQFLNCMSGGSMWQNVDNHGSSHLLHNLLSVPGIPEKSLMVTSTHHQMMVAGPEGIVIGIALSMDKKSGIAKKYESYVGRAKPKYDTEVVWYPQTQSLCFQPHPEYKQHTECRDYFFKLINHFFN